MRMDGNWQATRAALKEFANIISCERCLGQPTFPTRLNCKHLYCKQCIWNASNCFKCNSPIQPGDMFPDRLVVKLVNSCNMIADAIKEKSFWNESKSNAEDCIPTANHYRKRRASVPQSKSLKKKANISLKTLQKDIDKRNAKGETRLHTACAKGLYEDVLALLAAGASPNTKDNADWTPLQEAVNFGYIKICKTLLEFGAQPNAPGLENRTPLHEAACFNRLEEAKLLLQYNANKNVFDQFGKKPIHYATSDEMREILREVEEESDCEKVYGLQITPDQSFSFVQSKIVVFPSDLKEENKKLLSQMAIKHGIEIVSSFRTSVTHTIVEADNRNATNLSYDVMMAILSGTWLLSSEWISICMDVEDISEVTLEVFEVSVGSCAGVSRKARENAQNQNPRLFNNCSFYFHLQSNTSYHVGDVELTKNSLVKLVTIGDGKVLSREPDPEDTNDGGQFVPFHTAHDNSHPLYKCTNYIIYVPGKEEPRIKYNMPHIKTLPLIWLIECIEKFALVNPSHLGLL